MHPAEVTVAPQGSCTVTVVVTVGGAVLQALVARHAVDGSLPEWAVAVAVQDSALPAALQSIAVTVSLEGVVTLDRYSLPKLLADAELGDDEVDLARVLSLVELSPCLALTFLYELFF